MKKKNTSKMAKVVGIGAGAAALAASSYYLFGPKGKAHRKQTKEWMDKMKDEVIERISNIEDMSEGTFHKIVDAIVFAYIATDEATTPELQKFAEELKGQWKNIVKSLPKSKKIIEKKKS